MDSMSKYEREQFRANQKVVFAKKFNALIEKRDKGETYEDLADLLGVNRSTYYNWKVGNVLPGKDFCAASRRRPRIAA